MVVPLVGVNPPFNHKSKLPLFRVLLCTWNTKCSHQSYYLVGAGVLLTGAILYYALLQACHKSELLLQVYLLSTYLQVFFPLSWTLMLYY